MTFEDIPIDDELEAGAGGVAPAEPRSTCKTLYRFAICLIISIILVILILIYTGYFEGNLW